MKLTKDKKTALETLKKLIDFYLDENKKHSYYIKASEYALIKKHLGIDLKEAMFYKKEIDSFRKNAELKYLEILNPFYSSFIRKQNPKTLLFPFSNKNL